MEQAVILSGVRTPIGSFLGSLSSLTAPQLGSIAIRDALSRAGVAPDKVDEVIMGQVLQATVGQAPARQASLGAGIPNSVPCLTINKVCGSGMKAVMLAAQAIKLGDSKVVVAGGMESMSNAPYALEKARTGYRMGNGTLLDTMIHDGLWDPYNNCHMGNCGDATSVKHGFSREEIDNFAIQSFFHAVNAQEAGVHQEEIVAVPVPQKKGDPVMVNYDEGPAKGNPDKIPTLKPVFSKEGTTTAANASSINDGAAALVLSSESYAHENHHKVLGRVVGYATHAQEPEWFTTAPAYAIQKLLAAHNLKPEDIDVYEVNEAFAVVAMVVAKIAGIPEGRMNVNGGAVALGHPIGATGARLVLTALHELRRRHGKYAIATPCIGGGEATAVLIEAVY